jgi:outer membrane protein assembly factor BamE (lipoprotein component of BamABCDE complex)
MLLQERQIMRSVFTLFLVASLLTACDPQRAEKLEEGLSTEADVRKQFGEPTQIVEHADGSKLLEYPRQPEGWTNYAIEIGADGKMSSLRQLLSPANFAKVAPGMNQMAVRKLLGIPAKKITYPPKPDEEVWTWHFQQGQDKKDFDVVFNPQGQVQSTAISDDQRQQNRN